MSASWPCVGAVVYVRRWKRLGVFHEIEITKEGEGATLFPELEAEGHALVVFAAGDVYRVPLSDCEPVVTGG